MAVIRLRPEWLDKFTLRSQGVLGHSWKLVSLGAREEARSLLPGTGFDLEGQTASPRIPIHRSVSAGALEKHRWGQHTQVTQTQDRECGTAGAHNIGLGLSSELRSNAPTHSRVRR